MRKAIVLVIFLFLLFVGSALAERIVYPDAVYYYQPAASVFGSEALWVNPAGLYQYKPMEFQFIGDLADDNYFKNWGMVTARSGLGVGYRKFGSDDKEYSLGIGFPFGREMQFGVSYQNYKSDNQLFSDRHHWNIGMSGQAGPKFRWGAVLSNLNRAKINGEKSETEMRYSLSFRPLNEKLTLSVDMFLSTKTKFNNADFVYHLAGTPIPGLILDGYIDNDKNFELGVRTNLTQYFSGLESLFDKKANHQRSTFYFGATSLRQPTLVPAKSRRIEAFISGRPSENPTQTYLGPSQSSYLNAILDIYRAADDPYVSEMVVNFDKLSLGFAQAEELREALMTFKKKDKKLVAHISYPNNIAYYIATACDRIYIPEVSQLNLVGLKAELTFFGGTFEKLGINLDLLKIGDHKTAPEQYTQKESSEFNREQINRLLDGWYEIFVSAIAEGREISIDSVKKIIDNGPFTSHEAISYGLIDGFAFKSSDIEDLKKNKMPIVSLHHYHADTLRNDGWPQKPTLAIMALTGDVVSSTNQSPWFDGESDLTPGAIKEAIHQVKSDRIIDGIVLRINSLGGEALTGEDIYQELHRSFPQSKPVISMGNATASGGYYIAMMGDKIFASPSTLTGSIGIFGGKADLSKFYEKIELNKEMYLRGKYAGMLSNMRPFTDEEREKYYSQLMAMYQHFVSLVADNRNLPKDSIDQLGRGKVWSGADAKKNGLVDYNGGIKQALDYLAAQNNYTDYRVKIYPHKKRWFNLPELNPIKYVASIFAADKKDLDIITKKTEDMYTRLPFDISIE